MLGKCSVSEIKSNEKNYLHVLSHHQRCWSSSCRETHSSRCLRHSRPLAVSYTRDYRVGPVATYTTHTQNKGNTNGNPRKEGRKEGPEGSNFIYFSIHILPQKVGHFIKQWWQNLRIYYFIIWIKSKINKRRVIAHGSIVFKWHWYCHILNFLGNKKCKWP